MDRYVVMVDAGYLLRQSIEIVSGRVSTKRAQLDITDPAGLIKLLLEKSKMALDLGSRELLRVYWYDGVMSSGLTPQQRSIVELPDVHFRAGTVNSAGQQKGVDSLIVTDLIELAANHAVCDAVLISGDGDLAIGVELAQKKGVRIAVLGVEDLSVGVSHKQSFEVTSRADRVARIGASELSTLMHYVAPAPAPETPSTAAAPVIAPAPTLHRALDQALKTQIEGSVKTFISSQASLSGAIDPSTKRIDAAVDRALIHHVFTDLSHGKLTNDEKVYARARLRAELGI